MTESGCLAARAVIAPLLRAKTVIVWRVLISSASFVWVRYLLNSEYSGKPERMSVMLWAKMVETSADSVKERRREYCNVAMVEF